MLKEEMDAAAGRHPDVPYQPQLIDATFALLIGAAGEPLVIPSLNRDGDILSDLVLPLFGSIAGSESLLVAFDEAYSPSVLMAEAAHGTAPALFGKNVANPMAMILAGAALLSHLDATEPRSAGRAIREAALEAVSSGIRTADLGGHGSTSGPPWARAEPTQAPCAGPPSARAEGLSAVRAAGSGRCARRRTAPRARSLRRARRCRRS